MKHLLLATILLLFVAILSGCAAKDYPRVFWPPPPGEVALEFVGLYYSAADFEKTDTERFFEAFLGKDSGDGFKRPTGIASDGMGRVYVADQLLKTVRIFDFNQRHMHALTQEQIFSNPLGLAIDSQKRLFVVDAGLKKVLVFSPAEAFLFSFGSGELFANPAYIALNERLGRIYVSDGKGHKVVVFDFQGKYLFTFGKAGSAPGEFFGPQGLAIDRDNQVFVADQFNARVQVFDADGKYLRYFGERGDGVGQMEMPKALAFDSDGDLYVMDSRKGALTVYASNGDPQLFLGGTKSMHPLGFINPSFIAIDNNDRIYITDMFSRRFVVWQHINDAYRQAHPITETDIEKLPLLRK